MAEKQKKTAGEHLDHAIEKTKNGVHATKAAVQRHARNKFVVITIVLVVLILLALLLLSTCSGGEKATTEQAQDIAKMLKAEGVTIQGIRVTSDGYEITYAAESAVGRFDDALLYDWGMIYGIAGAHDCETVSIITTLDNEPLHKQTAGCESIRALTRNVITENEFLALVKHESLA